MRVPWTTPSETRTPLRRTVARLARLRTSSRWRLSFGATDGATTGAGAGAGWMMAGGATTIVVLGAGSAEPDSAIVRTPAAAVLATLSVAARSPAAVGAKATFAVQLALGARAPVQVLALTTKSAASGPVTVSPVTEP